MLENTKGLLCKIVCAKINPCVSGKRTGQGALRIAIEMVNEGQVTEPQALCMVGLHTSTLRLYKDTAYTLKLYTFKPESQILNLKPQTLYPKP